MKSGKNKPQRPPTKATTGRRKQKNHHGTDASAAPIPQERGAARDRDLRIRDDARTTTDEARDRRLRKDLQEESGRSASDRHRERLTAVEAEEDNAPEDVEERDALLAEHVREEDDQFNDERS